MNWIKRLIKRLRCDHRFEFKWNIYGDHINYAGGNRSTFRCAICGKWQDRPYLVKGDQVDRVTAGWIPQPS